MKLKFLQLEANRSAIFHYKLSSPLPPYRQELWQVVSGRGNESMAPIQLYISAGDILLKCNFNKWNIELTQYALSLTLETLYLLT